MLNKLILLGRLTRDVEVRTTTGGTTIAKGGIAVNTYRGKDKEDAVLFLDFVAFGKTAEAMGQYFKKGKPILLEGELTLQQWEAKDGSGKRSKHEMKVDSFTFVPSDNGGSDEQAAPPRQQRASGAGKSKGNDYGDIPF